MREVGTWITTVDSTTGDPTQQNAGLRGAMNATIRLRWLENPPLHWGLGYHKTEEERRQQYPDGTIEVYAEPRGPCRFCGSEFTWTATNGRGYVCQSQIAD